MNGKKEIISDLPRTEITVHLSVWPDGSCMSGYMKLDETGTPKYADGPEGKSVDEVLEKVKTDILKYL